MSPCPMVARSCAQRGRCAVLMPSGDTDLCPAGALSSSHAWPKCWGRTHSLAGTSMQRASPWGTSQPHGAHHNPTGHITSPRGTPQPHGAHHIPTGHSPSWHKPWLQSTAGLLLAGPPTTPPPRAAWWSRGAQPACRKGPRAPGSSAVPCSHTCAHTCTQTHGALGAVLWWGAVHAGTLAVPCMYPCVEGSHLGTGGDGAHAGDARITLSPTAAGRLSTAVAWRETEARAEGGRSHFCSL